MKHDLQLPVSIWNLLPVWYYRNKGEVENIEGYMVIQGYRWLLLLLLVCKLPQIEL